MSHHPHFPFKILTVTLTVIVLILVIVTICNCTTEEYSKKAEKRQAARGVKPSRLPPTTVKPKKPPSTTKPGGPTTTIAPGLSSSTTSTPNGTSTTMKPGASSSTMKPMSSTTKKPGGPRTTTKKGQKPVNDVTPNPNDNSTNPESTTTATPSRPPPQQLEGFDFIGYHSEIGYWVTTKESDKAGAVQECEKLRHISNYPGHVATIIQHDEVYAVDKMLTDYRDSDGSVLANVFIADIVEISPAGRTILTALTPYGKRTEDITDTDADLFLGKQQNKRNAKFHNHNRKRRVLVTRAKRQNEEAAFGEDDIETRGSIATGPPNSVTAKQVHYPWLADWKMEGESGGCSPDLTGCKPRNCTVTTKECKVKQKKCFIDDFVKCTEVNTTGCTAVCAKCNVTQPTCYQMDHKCHLLEPRKCTVSEPECSVVTPNCTVSRKPCVTKYPECHVAQTNNTCQVPQPCAKPQGSECKKEKRPCREEEIAAGKPQDSCYNYKCKSQAVCLTPTYCTEDQVICPYPTTFCPPEVVHCPQPYINCSKPETKCTDPVFDCPAPQIKCEEPFVYCAAPSITCPTVITQCENPNVICIPPTIDCPEPELVCDDPEPCEIPPPPPCPPDPPGSNECKDNCNCIQLVRQNSAQNGLQYAKKGTTCDQLLRALCLSNVGAGGGKSGGGQEQITEAPKRKG